ncbi:3-oxoacyl-ACP reductase FabG [Dactylosporangium sp. AC04546]|uniref:3-oxoacyl-ACP reductase FabG n=1 Tax=Dactylosporangium sp. AC04546 TaxID=2862460 RepID=UPI001EE0A82F|nr:3-oxoacyl-ACP reductase FabG [Dactylosporangium sp. AC04546]WVK84872.1 3-oxoacyl-ACP reductase FabG [Dactylosporangium sp. AC04546]
MRFAGRTAVVTGGAQGIGAATARLLAEQGADVVVLDLDATKAQKVADTLPKGRALGCNVTDKDQVDAVFAEIGTVDVLVNNAGITRDNLLFKMPFDEWNAVLNTNLTSMFLCTQAAQKSMVRQRYGRIVNLSSRSALGARGQVNYAAAKAGVQGLTATLAIELGPFNITVNAVAPGYIATAMTAATAERVGSTPEDHQAQVAERTPLRRVGQPEEVAAVIAFLASDEASYVSGQTLYVNGGAR